MIIVDKNMVDVKRENVNGNADSHSHTFVSEQYFENVEMHMNFWWK